MRILRSGSGPIHDLLWTVDGSSLVCVEGQDERSGAAAARWFSAGTGEETRCLNLEDEAKKWKPFVEKVEVGKAWISPDGGWVAVQQYLGDPVLLQLWSAAKDKWRLAAPIEEFWYCVDAAAFSPGGGILVSASGTDGGGTKALERIHVKTGRRLPAIDFPGYSVLELVFSLDERRLAASSFSKVFLFSHQRGAVTEPAVKLPLEDEPGSIRFRPDGEELAILDHDRILFWDGRTPKAEEEPLQGEGFLCLAWSPDGEVLVVGGRDGTVRFWNRKERRETDCFDWRIGAISAIAFSPDGMTCAAGGEKGQIVVQDVVP